MDDDEDELPPGEDDEFDMEAYLKWRAENPDEGVPVGGQQRSKNDDPGAELPEDDDDDGDDYDDEDD